MDAREKLLQEIEQEFIKDPSYSYFFLISQHTFDEFVHWGTYEFSDNSLSHFPSPCTQRKVRMSFDEPNPSHLSDDKMVYLGALMVTPCIGFVGSSNTLEYEYLDFEGGIYLYKPKNFSIPHGKVILKRKKNKS